MISSPGDVRSLGIRRLPEAPWWPVGSDRSTSPLRPGQVRIFRGEQEYVAECLDLPVVTEAATYGSDQSRLPGTLTQRSSPTPPRFLPRSSQGPPGAHAREAEFAPFSLPSAGMKPAICSPTSGRSGTSRNTSRLQNAAHCVCLERSSKNSPVRASGTASGIGVRLRSKVLPTEPASRSRSNVWVWASVQISKKSFIRSEEH